MQHRNAEFGIVRRTFTCATLATLTTIGLFGLVAHLMSRPVDQARSIAADDNIPIIELTVIKGTREAVPVGKAVADTGKTQRPEAI